MLTLGHGKCIPSEGARVLFHVTGKIQCYLLTLISLQHVHMLRTILFWRSYLGETNGDHLTRGQHVFWLRWFFSRRSRKMLIWGHQRETDHQCGGGTRACVTLTPCSRDNALHCHPRKCHLIFVQSMSLFVCCHHKYWVPQCLSPLLCSLSTSQSQVAVSLTSRCPYLTISCDLDLGQVQYEYVSVSSKSTPA